MRWHKEERLQSDGVLRHPADGESWKEFDKKHKNFAADPRNVRLGLATDGFNPFGKSNSYNMWPVMLVPYNLPPWKMMKPSYTIMSLLIPGPRAPGREIDIYLRPLINELKDLWGEGTEVYDASTSHMFRLRAAVMWTIHDFLAYGSITGWSTKGYKACPVCLQDTMSCHLRSKICYTGHRRFLQAKHSWRKNKSFCNGKFESEGPPRSFSGCEIISQLNILPEVTFGKSLTVSGKRKRLVSNSNWVKKSIFFELEYWSDLILRHNLDIMHIEKNICDVVVGTLLCIDGKSKDTVKARLDLQDMGIRRELHLQKNGDKISKPHASYTLALDERREFLHFIQSVRFSDGYAANISRSVNDRKLSCNAPIPSEYRTLPNL